MKILNDAEVSRKRKICNLVNAVKKKYLALKLGRSEEDNTINRIFKPVTTPLNKLLEIEQKKHSQKHQHQQQKQQQQQQQQQQQHLDNHQTILQQQEDILKQIKQKQKHLEQQQLLFQEKLQSQPPPLSRRSVDFLPL